MAQVVIPDGSAQLVIHFTGLSPMGSDPVTSAGVSLAPSPNFDDLNAAIPAAVAGLLNSQDSSWGVTSVTVRIGAAAPPYVSYEVPTPGVSGGVSGQSSPPNVAALLALATLSPGRAGKGRMFIPGVPETEVDDAGVLAGTYVSDMVDNYGVFQDTLVGSGAVDAMTLLHGEGSPLAGDPTPIVSVVCRGVAATQRRRLRR